MQPSRPVPFSPAPSDQVAPEWGTVWSREPLLGNSSLLHGPPRLSPSAFRDRRKLPWKGPSRPSGPPSQSADSETESRERKSLTWSTQLPDVEQSSMTTHLTSLGKASQGRLLPSGGLVHTFTVRQVPCQGSGLGEQGGKVSRGTQPGRHFSQLPVLAEPRLVDSVLCTSGEGWLLACLWGVMPLINLSQTS